MSEADPEALPLAAVKVPVCDEDFDPVLIPDADVDVVTTVAFEPPETDAPLPGTCRLTVK